MATSSPHVAQFSHRRVPAVLELLKPVTWFPPMWALVCGFVSAGGTGHLPWQVILAAILLVGPLVCGTSQAVNDWFDRHVDAINEPGRPIPSGRLPGRLGLYIAIGWTAVSLLLALELGRWIAAVTGAALVLAWAYSAPPLRLKRNGWIGNAACALCYEGLPWITASALVVGTLPDWRILAVALLYSAGAHGIMTLNDFKSTQGDWLTGVGSLPVRMGAMSAAILACFAMAAAQVGVIATLCVLGRYGYAAAVGVLLVAQLVLMDRFLEHPVARALWFSAYGVLLYVLGMLVTAFALRPGV
ncbi:MAG: chlorophyll synthase ChlG [Proteobacteria bacterium]|nr:chlorophyll synthase ChlG [Pseudomonadota bacterium]